MVHLMLDLSTNQPPKTPPTPNPLPEQTQACENSTFNKFRFGVWFKLLSSRTSFQLNELDTADLTISGVIKSAVSNFWTQQTVKVFFLARLPAPLSLV